MSPVSRTGRVWALCVTLLAACATGCMIEPGHGQAYSSRDSQIQFMGAALEPGTRVEIQALHPSRGWQRLTEVTADQLYSDHNGEWYIWSAEQSVPRAYWTAASSSAFWRYQTTIRAVNVTDGDTFYTFDQSFPWPLFVDSPGPEYRTMSVLEMWDRWGHGTTVTVYAQRLTMRR